MAGRHRRPSRTSSAPSKLALTATVAAVAVQPLVAQNAAAATVVVPAPLAKLPMALDAVPAYNEQRSCDPQAKPGVEAFARLVLATYRQGHSGGIVRGCGLGSTSEHKEGRAFDWMLSVNNPAEKAAGDAFTQWLTGRDAQGVVGGNARRLGVMYVIWNRRIWSTYRIADGWRPYSGASAHTDHVHTSFTWDGAMGRTSFWDGSATTNDDTGPCRVYAGQPAPLYTGVRHTVPCSSRLPSAPSTTYGIVWPGQTGSTVKVAQARLGVAADGVFGSGTRARLVSWQRSADVPVTGVLDKPTWHELVPASTAPKPTPPTPPTPTTPTPTPPTPSAATTTSLTPYKTTVLRAGSRGAAVSALQRALGLKADGVLGTATVTAVRQLQTAQRLPATGVVDARTWAALERAAYPLLPYRTAVLRQGSRGSTVIVLQRALHVTADGAFGPKTAAALKAAQTRARLRATAVTDVATWVALEQVAYPLGRPLVPAAKPATTAPKPPATTAPKPPATTAPKPPATTAPKPAPTPSSAQTIASTTSVSAYKATVLRTGSRGAAVKALQRALGMAHVDGAFGPVTAATVRSFQKSRHLPQTGVVDRRTWDAAELVAHPLLRYRTTVLRSGSRGPAVVVLQRALRLTADGAFGPKTAAAVKAAQARGHVAATGTVATLTWITIEQQAYPLGRKRW
ncbi:MAG TPA: peptidoglycan-binding domain-containing protein [Angustibacter sp.]|nr:peptidoglycan-binding domain-containing protein [Angustibacter sp.]